MREGELEEGKKEKKKKGRLIILWNVNNCSCYTSTGFKFLVNIFELKQKVDLEVTPPSVNAYCMPCSNNNVMQPIFIQ